MMFFSFTGRNKTKRSCCLGDLSRLIFREGKGSSEKVEELKRHVEELIQNNALQKVSDVIVGTFIVNSGSLMVLHFAGI